MKNLGINVEFACINQEFSKKFARICSNQNNKNYSRKIDDAKHAGSELNLSESTLRNLKIDKLNQTSVKNISVKLTCFHHPWRRYNDDLHYVVDKSCRNVVYHWNRSKNWKDVEKEVLKKYNWQERTFRFIGYIYNRTVWVNCTCTWWWGSEFVSLLVHVRKSTRSWILDVIILVIQLLSNFLSG